jgi:hypothetical protein
MNNETKISEKTIDEWTDEFTTGIPPMAVAFGKFSYAAFTRVGELEAENKQLKELLAKVQDELEFNAFVYFVKKHSEEIKKSTAEMVKHEH